MAKAPRHRIDPQKVFAAQLIAQAQAMAEEDAGPPTSSSRAALHREALRGEHEEAEARGLLRCARNLSSFEVARVGDAESRERTTLPELLAREERLLVVGARGAGKSTLVARVALQVERGFAADPERSLLPFVVPVQLLEPGERLDVATVARMSPAGGRLLVERMLAERRALILVDGLDGAPGGSTALRESLPDFAGAHPGNRIVVTTRPLPTGIAGYQRTDLPAFTTVAMLPPALSSRLHPAHRFLARRTPARKAALYLERVDALLGAWDAERLPPGSVLGRLPREDQRKLAAAAGVQMHRSRSYEIAATALATTLQGMPWSTEGGAVGPAAGLVDELVAEIRRHPGLLVERRRGWFAFADFALHEALVAVAQAELGETARLVRSCHDPWWHGVIEVAAGLPGVDAASLVSGMLQADADESPAVTLLAARCAEAAPALSDAVRQRVEERMAEIVPPGYLAAADRLVAAGDVGAPLLLRAIPTSGPVERALSALVLGRLHYEPACGALLGLSSDTEWVDAEIVWPLAGYELDLGDEPVAVSALAALFEIARVSRVGRSALRRALARAPFKALDHFRIALMAVFDDFVDGPPREVIDLNAEVDQMYQARRSRPRGGRRG